MTTPTPPLQKKIHQSLREFTIAIAFFIPLITNATTISRAAQAPAGANDIDVDFTYIRGKAENAVVEARTTIPGNPEPTVTSTTGGGGRVTWSGDMSGGSVWGWAIKFNKISGAEVTNWYFTKDGVQVGNALSFLSGSFNMTDNGNLIIQVENPTTRLITATNFEIFINQNPILLDDLYSFINNEFSGSSVTGIPSSISLNPGESITFTTNNFPDLVTAPGSLVAFQGSIDGTRFLVADSVPEPATISLLIASLIGFSALNKKRHRISFL